MLSQVLRKPSEGRRLDYCEIVSVNDMAANFPCGFDKKVEVVAELWRSARDVHDLGPMLANPLTHPVRHRFGHHLLAPWRGVHMAMLTGLVAFAADVDLQGLKPLARQDLATCCEFSLKQVHHFKLVES